MVARNTMVAALRDLLEWTRKAVASAAVSDDSSRDQRFVYFDRLDQRTHLGFSLTVPTSTNAESVDGVTTEWISETIVVVLSMQVARTPGQLEMYSRAADHEATIRDTVCSASDLAAHQPVWTGTVREVSPDRAWLTSTLTFRMRRFEAVRS